MAESRIPDSNPFVEIATHLFLEDIAAKVGVSGLNNYLPIGMQPGTHRVRIEADLDGNGIIDSSRGEAFASDLFYRTTPGLGTGWTIAIGIAVFLPVLIATVAMRRRQRA